MRVLMFLALAACGGSGGGGGGGGGDDGDTLASPPGTAWTTTGTTTLPLDTADLATDRVPGRTLRVKHHGYWDLGPPGGPYTSMTGRLTVQEGVNGVVARPSDTAVDSGDTGAPLGDPPNPPDCWARFDLVGVETEYRTCPGCTVVLEITHTLAAGSLDDCIQPDLLEPGEDRTYGWDDDGGIWWDYQNSDVWVRVWDGVLEGDRLQTTWTHLFAIDGQDTGDTGEL